MKSRRQRDTYFYKLGDFLTAMVAWACFFMFRKCIEGAEPTLSLLNDLKFYYGILIIPIGWLLLYSLFDDYRDIYRLSRLATLARTFMLALTGVIVLFFTLILDDFVKDYRTYYTSFIVLFLLQFLLTSISRMILITLAHRRLVRGVVNFPTLLLGGNMRARELYNELSGHDDGLGYNFIGYITTSEDYSDIPELHLKKPNSVQEKFPVPCLGTLGDLDSIIKSHEVEDVIVAIETREHEHLREILDQLFHYGDRLKIRIIPNMYDIMLGSVQMTEVYGAPLITIKQELMPKWEILAKRLMDILASTLVLTFGSVFFMYFAIRVKLSSKGPVIFRQERIGFNGKPFELLKFRSMYTNAEDNGPQLTQAADPRCTPWGNTMRKWRIDELPNFWNVLRGDMSLVGPRPERQYFIDQIVKQAPHYRHLLKVRPGITSWGQVKYGYASNVSEMVQRLRFDILYIENMSLVLDLKILAYTIKIILQGRGK
jgi:exopolysaccharide biosynthesis polyprenyl glycosylphosphotransferase